METPPPVIVRKARKFFKPESPPTPVNDWDSILLIDDNDPADVMLLDNSEMPMTARDSKSVMEVSRTLDDISFSTPAETPRRAMSFATSTPGTILRRPMSTLRGGARRLFSDEADVTFEEDGDGPSPIQYGDGYDSGTFLTPDRRTIPIGPSRVLPFEIFEDDESTPVNMSSRSQVSVRRVFANTARAAQDFALVVFSAARLNTGRIYVTRKTETLNPQIEAGCGVVEQGRCRFSFQNNFLASNQERENNRPGDVVQAEQKAPGHVGIIEIGRSLFPATISRGRSDVLDVDPVFITPANAHVTVLMPSEVAAFISLDHFVVQIFSTGNWRTKLMNLAIHKSVFARLLLVDSLSIPFSNVPVAPGEYVNMLMHVSRVRRQKKRINNAGITLEERVYVVIKSIDFSVPEGFERIRFAEDATIDFEDMGMQMVVALPARKK